MRFHRLERRAIRFMKMNDDQNDKTNSVLFLDGLVVVITFVLIGTG